MDQKKEHKLFTKTFGCQMNFADSDEMGRHLANQGFQPTENETDADTILVNTCTVRDLAEHKAMSFIGRLREWKQSHPNGRIIVTGCAAERAKQEMKRKFPHVDLIVGAKDIEKFPKDLNELLNSRHPGESRDPGLNPAVKKGLQPGPRLSPGRRMGPVQYVTTMRGCNYNCTYCIVPSVRGREVYIGVEEILKNVRERVAEGAKEIWLLGQTVNSYKPTEAPMPGYDFSNLVRDVAKVPGVARIRFMSPHPYYLTPNLIQAMAETPALGEHIHLPVQSGSNPVLVRMKRNYTRESYLKGIAALRQAIPKISITTDIIVGFPGETEEDYQQTLSLVREAKFDSAYCFKYSPRPGTAAAAWDDDIPDEVKEARVNELLSITDNQGAAIAASLVGSVQEVLIEELKEEAMVRGKTRGAWRVRIKNEALKPGDLVNVKITSTHSRELHGELINPQVSKLSMIW